SMLRYPVDLTSLEPAAEAKGLVSFAPVPAPFLEHPDGYPSIGGGLPHSLRRLRHSSICFGHALRPGKADPVATLAVLVQLNRLADHAPRRRFALFIAEQDLARFQQAAAAWPEKLVLDDLIIPVPPLDNRSLFKLMRRCLFCLCFDVVGDAFGIYPLESIHNDVPVYTSGAGNLRWLLPPGCGLEVFLDPDLALGPLKTRIAAHGRVAARILVHLVKGSREDCARGKMAIARLYDYATFRRRLENPFRDCRRHPVTATKRLKV